MFIKDREEILKAIYIMQRESCDYDAFSIGHKDAKPPRICDCKYGYKGIAAFGDEQNGCPELRCVVELLTLMTDEEYSDIMKRHGHMQT